MTRFAQRLFLLILPLGFTFSQLALGQSYSKMEQAISQLKADDGSSLSVEAAMEQYGLPGLSVAVFEDYEIVWTKSWGVKAVGTQEKIDDQTAFSTASISKAITGTLFVMLEEEGLIDLDAEVNDYLKRYQLPENEFTEQIPVTFKHLLSHTAGTTQHGFADFYQGDKVPSLLESVLGKLPRYDAPITVDFLPGSQWRYSGGGFSLAQMAVEDKLGKTLAELTEEYIFAPLGMQHTTMYQHGHPKFLTNVAKVHNEKGEIIRSGIPICPQTAASAMWSIPTDMAIFLIEMQKALAGKPTQVISPTVARKVTEIATTKGIGGWSLGWERYHRMGNREWFSHGGSNTGTGGHIYATMKDGHGIAFFGNGPNGNRIPVLDKLRNSVIESHGWKLPNPYASSALAVDRKVQEEMVGLYLSPFQEIMSVQAQQDKLFMPGFGGQRQTPLYRLNDNTYAMEESNLFLQYRQKQMGESSKKQIFLAMIPEKDAQEPVFVLTKLSDDPTQPLELFHQGKTAQFEAIYTHLPIPDQAKEDFLNGQGYRFLGSKEIEAAIAVFQINVDLFPNSANVYDSLGEAYLLQGDKEKARLNYRKSLELNPENETAKRVLEGGL